MQVDRILLVSGAEVEHPATASTISHAGAEHLTTVEGADEDQLVRLGDVEELAVRLMLAPITNGLESPSAIGCAGATVQTSSRSSRQASEHVVPMSLVKIFEK
jgi:hypothetical protein